MEKAVSEMDMSRLSREAWTLLRKFDGTLNKTNTWQQKVSLNSVTTHLTNITEAKKTEVSIKK